MCKDGYVRMLRHLGHDYVVGRDIGRSSVRVSVCVQSLPPGKAGRGLDGGVIKEDIWMGALVTVLMH